MSPPFGPFNISGLLALTMLCSSVNYTLQVRHTQDTTQPCPDAASQACNSAPTDRSRQQACSPAAPTDARLCSNCWPQQHNRQLSHAGHYLPPSVDHSLTVLSGSRPADASSGCVGCAATHSTAPLCPGPGWSPPLLGGMCCNTCSNTPCRPWAEGQHSCLRAWRGMLWVAQAAAAAAALGAAVTAGGSILSAMQFRNATGMPTGATASDKNMLTTRQTQQCLHTLLRGPTCLLLRSQSHMLPSSEPLVTACCFGSVMKKVLLLQYSLLVWPRYTRATSPCSVPTSLMALSRADTSMYLPAACWSQLRCQGPVCVRGAAAGVWQSCVAVVDAMCRNTFPCTAPKLG